jgi:hypothetical protein
MTKPLMSHELASLLLKAANALFVRQDVELPGVEKPEITVDIYDREIFLNIVRELGAGSKTFGSYYFEYRPNNTTLVLRIPRN